MLKATIDTLNHPVTQTIAGTTVTAAVTATGPSVSQQIMHYALALTLSLVTQLILKLPSIIFKTNGNNQSYQNPNFQPLTQTNQNSGQSDSGTRA
ncbi:hypothetical protein [Mucilaginibacter sp.]